jgi:hypothetical protein
MAERITARARASVEEALVATSAHRPTLNRPEVMEKLKSTAWLGRVIALQGLLKLVSKMSLTMQTVNVVPWELMDEQRAFYDKLLVMEEALRDRPKDSDPRWSTIPPSPFPQTIFPFFHEEPDPKNYPGQSRVQMLLAGTYMGQALIVPEEERAEGATDEFAHLEATFDLSYDVAKWLECAAHFFHVRFLRDEHGMLNIASKCLDLRRFTALTAHATEFRPDNYEDIKEPLQIILEWMIKGGVQDVPDIDVVFEQAMLLARSMEKEVIDFYKGCSNPNTACHKWHYKTEDGVLHAHSGTIIQKDIWTTASLHSSSPAFLWVYNHVMLKTGNEAVVEGMCKVIGRQADSTRGLSIGRYAKEARLVWNVPLQHEADPFLTESLDQHFGPSKWHFYSADKKTDH